MRIFEKTKTLNNFLSVPFMLACIASANASIVGDTPEIAELREKFIEAVESNNPDTVAKLVTDDYVMLQPNHNGPDTYGKKSYINYRKSLRTVVDFSVKPDRVIRCGDEWAFEASVEQVELDDWLFNDHAKAYVLKVLNKDESGEWKYARTHRAWSLSEGGENIIPPAPEFIANTGFSTWKPRQQDEAETQLVQEMMDFQDQGTRKLVSEETKDSVGFMSNVVIRADESTGEMIAYSAYGAIYGIDQYLAMRESIADSQVDEIRKIWEEGIACEETMGFVWGQGVSTGASADGERYIGNSDSIYVMTKQNGQWKMGPIGIIASE